MSKCQFQNIMISIRIAERKTILCNQPHYYVVNMVMGICVQEPRVFAVANVVHIKRFYVNILYNKYVVKKKISKYTFADFY